MFENIASTYGNVDRTEAGAFASDAGKQVPLLWTHKRDEPGGLGRLQETPEGIRVEGKLDLDTVAGREAYTRVKKGIVRALSIGFEVIDYAFERTVRVIQKGQIHEVSLVLFPANDRATILAAKEEVSGAMARELLSYCSINAKG